MFNDGEKYKFECPTAEVLINFVQGKLDRVKHAWIQQHARKCDYCLLTINSLTEIGQKEDISDQNIAHELIIPEKIKTLLKEEGGSIKKIASLKKPERALFGQIWSTKGENISIPKIVVVVFGGDSKVDEEKMYVMIAPVSNDIQYACEMDLIVKKDESNHLGFEYMIEVWNTQLMFASQLNKYLGRLDESRMDSFQLLTKASYGDLAALNKVTDKGEKIVDSSDIRISFHRKEREETKYLREPVELFIAKLEAAEARKEEEERVSPLIETIIELGIKVSSSIQAEYNTASKAIDDFKIKLQGIRDNLKREISIAGGLFEFDKLALDAMKPVEEKAEDVREELAASEEQEFIFDVRFFARDVEKAPYVQIRAKKKLGDYTDNPPIHLVQLWKDSKGGEKEVKVPEKKHGGIFYAEFSLEEAESNKKSSPEREGEYTFKDFRKDHCIFVITPFS
jgi:hypothetical protein